MNGLTPDITAAEIVRHGVLRLTFADGRSGEVEVQTACGALFSKTPARSRDSPGSKPIRRPGPSSGPGALTSPRHALCAGPVRGLARVSYGRLITTASTP